MKSFLGALRIVLVYFLFSLIWILFSDALLEYFVQNLTVLTKLQTYKGMFFIVVTSFILFSLIRSKLNEISKIEKQLKDNEQRLQYVIQGADLGYWDWNYQTNQQLVNDKWLEFLGLKREDIKENVTDWSQRIHPEDRIMTQKVVAQTIKDSKPYVIEFRMRHRDGQWVWIEGSGAVVERDNDGQPLRLAGTHKNISFRKQAAEEMSFLAHNDALTKLPNRIFLKTKLEEFLQIPSQDLAFLFLDLDYFKNINDVYGHTFGDKVIQDVALRFKKAIGEQDFIARVGGDEFVILTPKVLHVEQLCRDLASSIELPFHIDDETFSLGVSIGIAISPQDGQTFEALFKNADTAMYVAKNSGKNRYKYYTQMMSDIVFESTKMDNEMKKGIENDEFVLHYQPQIDLKSGLVVGVEALVRWQNPFKGFIPPNDFIPRAEENRLIIPLGAMIFKKALVQVKAWREEGVFDGVMAINISGVQIEEDDFVETLEAILKEEGI
ncbi:MAG: diguanylate cyclase, partial [Sulfurospirillaceae bacterium]|nr:diguanylate cyclase [Sulfurospirillaceae bacterium]